MKSKKKPVEKDAPPAPKPRATKKSAEPEPKAKPQRSPAFSISHGKFGRAL